MSHVEWPDILTISLYRDNILHFWVFNRLPWNTVITLMLFSSIVFALKFLMQSSTYLIKLYKWDKQSLVLALLRSILHIFQSQAMASSATSASLPRTGMTVLLAIKSSLVLLVLTAVAKRSWITKWETYQSRYTPKVVSRRWFATQTAAKPLHLMISPHSRSKSASWTAAARTCAMEPFFQWSAPSCCWHALLWLFSVEWRFKKCVVLLEK